MSDGLDIIDPAGGEVTFAGRKVVIKPLPVGRLSEFSRAMKPVLPLVDKIGEISAMPLGDLLDLLADNVQPVVRLISIATGIEERELNEASPADLLALVAPVIKVNADFFRLRPLLGALLAKRTASPGPGPTP